MGFKEKVLLGRRDEWNHPGAFLVLASVTILGALVVGRSSAVHLVESETLRFGVTVLLALVILELVLIPAALIDRHHE